MASSTSAQFRITPPPLPAGYSGKLNLASVSSKAFFFGHKTTAFYPKLRAKSVVLRVINEKVDGVDLETTNWARGSELMHALNMKMGPHGQQIPPLCRGVDVSPLSLGLETLGGVMIIPRNTTLPTSKSEVFSTAVDGQTNVKINVFIGEREFAWDNRYVCSFILNIPPAPRGVPQIEVKFCINSDGILSVTAVDKGTGENLGIGIINLHNRKSMRRMVIEAERFVKDYKEKRDAIDTKNEAESVVYQTEKQLKELGETSSPQAIKDAIAVLNQEVLQLGQSVYNQPGAPGAGPRLAPGGEFGPSESSGKGLEGDVIDADFTDQARGLKDVINADFIDSN
nr:stromal 70 kda heat shock-related protein, chloroplastic [Quercus suber]